MTDLTEMSANPNLNVLEADLADFFFYFLILYLIHISEQQNN